MTSYYARHHSLSQQTLDAYTRYNDRIVDRLCFYYYYLQDVVPDGVWVRHIPSVPSRDPGYQNTRQAIELRTYTGRIVMYGLVSMDRRPDQVETVAADEAYTRYDDGYFVGDDRTWRFFTGLDQLRVYSCVDGDEWELMGHLSPISDAREMARYLQDLYDSLSDAAIAMPD